MKFKAMMGTCIHDIQINKVVLSTLHIDMCMYKYIHVATHIYYLRYIILFTYMWYMHMHTVPSKVHDVCKT
jgi:hypothetical protein